MKFTVKVIHQSNDIKMRQRILTIIIIFGYLFCMKKKENSQNLLKNVGGMKLNKIMKKN